MINLTHSFSMYYFMPLHVSNNKCSSSGGLTCINTSSGITHSGGWLSDVPAWQAGQTFTQQSVLYQIWYDIFVNCKWVATRWQLYNTRLHTNNTQNDTKQTIHSTTQNLRTVQNFGRVRAVPGLGELYPGICLTTEEKARKNLSQGSRTTWIHKCIDTSWSSWWWALVARNM
jgi:hypothetical protein